MLWPALRALAIGELSEDQVSWLRDEWGLTEGPRIEPPAAEDSVAHRRLTDDQGVELVLDLANTDGDGWEFVLFQTTGDRPSDAFVETQRAAFRAAIDHLGLRLVEIHPPAAVDEVLVIRMPPEYESQSAFDDQGNLPDNLETVWRHFGLRDNTPREVKELKLRELMRISGWRDAPPTLLLEAQEFLDDL